MKLSDRIHIVWHVLNYGLINALFVTLLLQWNVYDSIIKITMLIYVPISIINMLDDRNTYQQYEHN